MNGLSDEQVGSPPHMRGKVFQLRGQGIQTGITPAHAGKSPDCRSWYRLCGDHPRTCGEKWESRYKTGCNPGSPPHMRGKEEIVKDGRRYIRITPAHAGKRTSPPYAAPGDQDHPRTCGEKARTLKRTTAGKGSPPHMRGKVTWCCSFLDGNRITPAHAGKRVILASCAACP